MTRLGWGILIVILALVGGFASLVSFGPGNASSVAEAPADPSLAEVATSGQLLTVPVAGIPRGAIRDNWGDARGDGTRSHHGIDIMAPRGTPVLAAAAGTVERLFQSQMGGTTAYVRTADGRWTHYYAHLAGYAAGLREGLPVRAGQTIGYVGDTGDAGLGNYHLHFSVTRRAPGERWWQGEDVNPYPLLAGRGAAR